MFKIFSSAPITLILIFFSLTVPVSAQNSYELNSPDGNIKVTIKVGNIIQYAIQYKRDQILDPSKLSLSLQGHGTLGKNPQVDSVNKNKVDEILHPVVQQKSETIRNHYNELSLHFSDRYSVIFRAYNGGVAYRFKTNLHDHRIKVKSEQLEYNFADNYHIYFPEEESFITHQERYYKYLRLNDISSDRFSSIPALVEVNKGPNVLITEADLQDYPGFYLQGTQSNRLEAIFPAVSIKEAFEPKSSDRNYYPTERADYIAKTSGSRSYPWRVLIIEEEDGELITNQMVYKLAQPSQIEDPSWIIPGKVSWDWWNAWNIYDVDFKAGINNQTYKYYIDFASRMGLQYIIMDDGWYELGDLLTESPDIDVQELVNYGKKKGVDIILWASWKTLEDQWEEAFDQFSEWGIKGLKIDFMQRDDQWMVNWYWKVAKEAAKRHMLVDFHGSYKPSGLRRTYPNVITREGVKGLENNKWSDGINPEHDVTIPFIRMAVGPMDYTPGAMINAQPENFSAVNDRPMSQGTRMHQLAMYVIYESPLQMLADSPTHYLKEKQEIRDYLSEVPVTWDETQVLEASIGEYVVIARRKGNQWFIGAMTNEEPRSFTLDLSFLNSGTYTANIYSDGINADRYGNDYSFSTQEVKASQQLNIELAKSGGWAAIINKN